MQAEKLKSFQDLDWAFTKVCRYHVGPGYEPKYGFQKFGGRVFSWEYEREDGQKEYIWLTPQAELYEYIGNSTYH